MRTDFSFLPAHKQQELSTIVELIRAAADVEMIILFGSHARDESVEDRYVKDGITYEYCSDFDLMVVIDCERESGHANRWNRVRERIRDERTIRTPVGLITEDIRQVNRQLERGQYFYTDIKREGMLLHDAGRWELAGTRRLDPRERVHIAQAHFDQWFPRGESALKIVRFCLEEDETRDAAFMLHQAAERFLVTAILVHTDYKPKTHDIEALHRQAGGLDARFLPLFPQATDFQRRAFGRLKRAYTEARFEPDFEISREELDWLAEQVEALQRVTDEACRKEIDRIDG